VFAFAGRWNDAEGISFDATILSDEEQSDDMKETAEPTKPFQ
jgi:hypothetical protein